MEEEGQSIQLAHPTRAERVVKLLEPLAVDGVDDAEEWARTADKLGSLGFSSQQQAELLELLSAVLLLGNVLAALLAAGAWHVVTDDMSLSLFFACGLAGTAPGPC